MTQQPVEGIFARAWALLTRNWIIIVPGLVIGLVVGIVRALVAPPMIVTSDGTYGVGNVFATFAAGLLAGLVSLIGYIATTAYTTGMAGAAWTRGSATIADGAAAFRTDAGRILVTAVGVALLALVATVLALPTLGLSFIAFYLFTLYAMASAIVGNRPGFTAIAESFRIATSRFVPTLIIGILIFVIAALGGVLAGLLRFAPLIGPIVAACITQGVIAFATLVVVGEYIALTGPSSPTATPGSFERRL